MAVRKKSKPAGIDKEEQFTGLLNILPDVVMIHKEGIIIYANQAALIATGCTQQELVGSNLLNYVVNDYKDTIIKKMQLREKGENSGDYVCELIKKSGEIRTAIVRSSDIFFNNEPAVLFILIDITNHIKVETALKLNNQKLEAILSSTPDGIGMVSLDGKMQFMSDKLLEIYGYPLEMKKDLVGRNSIDFLDPSEHARLYQNMQKLIHGKSERNLSEYLAVKKDSSTFYVELNSTILFDFDGNPEYILFVGREITKRKMAEAEYRQHSEEISALYETSRDLTGLPMDLNKLLTTITQRAISLLKGFYGGVYLYDKEQGDLFLAIETIPSNLAGNHVKFGQGIAGIVAQTRQPMIIDDYRNWPNRLSVYDNIPLTAVIEVPLLYRNQLIGVLAVEEYGETGRTFTEDDMRLLTIFAGQAAGAVHSAQLFYNVQQVNEELEIRLNELHSAQEEIQKINVELKEANANKDKFFSIISHDLRSPFQGLTSAAQILAEDFENLPKEETALLIKMLNSRIKNVYKLIDNLLQWSLNQMNKREYEPADIDLSNVVNKIISELHDDFMNKKLIITNEVHKKTTVHADTNMLLTIVRNLLANSIKFSYPGGNINISSFGRDHFIEVSIKDSGTGISPEIRENLFQVEKSHSVIGTAGEKGTGLGLPLCREFVEMHGGLIWVDTIEGKGSTFHFTLPVI